jgi:hypothetical protein
MGNEARTLLTKALALSDSRRADLPAELLASLDEPTFDSQADATDYGQPRSNDVNATADRRRRSDDAGLGTARHEGEARRLP